MTDATTTPAAESAERWEFRLFYDRDCPMCRLEVEWLERRNRDGKLVTEDIAAPGFDPSRYGLTAEQVMAQLHGATRDGRVTVGMESVRLAYRAVGLGWLMAWSGWPVLRWFADLGYRVFARYRVPLGRLFGRRCEDGACAVPRRPRT